jgi:FkbM family methyltransferase
MKSYSHLGEDVYCFQNFMNIPRRDAVLFEVGAYDGEAYSNTYALEQVNGCKCVLIEPSPNNVRRIYVNRPNASIHNLAIMANFGVCEFVGDAPVSGIQSELSKHYISAWNLDTARRYNVLTAPLSVIIEIEKVEYIDFLSIDVQGSEFFVLCSMNWKVPVGVICIELEGQRPEYDEACRGILKGLGFQFKCRLLISEFWYKPDYFRSNLLFDSAQKMYQVDEFEHLYWDGKFQSKLRGNFY